MCRGGAGPDTHPFGGVFHKDNMNNFAHGGWRRVLRTPLPLPEGVPQVLTPLDGIHSVMVIWTHNKRAWKIRIDTKEDFHCDPGV